MIIKSLNCKFFPLFFGIILISNNILPVLSDIICKSDGKIIRANKGLNPLELFKRNKSINLTIWEDISKFKKTKGDLFQHLNKETTKMLISFFGGFCGIKGFDNPKFKMDRIKKYSAALDSSDLRSLSLEACPLIFHMIPFIPPMNLKDSISMKCFEEMIPLLHKYYPHVNVDFLKEQIFPLKHSDSIMKMKIYDPFKGIINMDQSTLNENVIIDPSDVTLQFHNEKSPFIIIDKFPFKDGFSNHTTKVFEGIKNLTQVELLIAFLLDSPNIDRVYEGKNYDRLNETITLEDLKALDRIDPKLLRPFIAIQYHLKETVQEFIQQKFNKGPFETIFPLSSLISFDNLKREINEIKSKSSNRIYHRVIKSNAPFLSKLFLKYFLDELDCKKSNIESCKEIQEKRNQDKFECFIIDNVSSCDGMILNSPPIIALGDDSRNASKSLTFREINLNNVPPEEYFQILSYGFPIDSNLNHEFIKEKTKTMSLEEISKLIIEAQQMAFNRAKLAFFYKGNREKVNGKSKSSCPIMTTNDFIEAFKVNPIRGRIQKPVKSRPVNLKSKFGIIERPNIDWDKDVGGMQELKNKLELTIAYNIRPEMFKSIGIEKARHTLMFGPPGCGKTTIARAIASKSNIPLMTVGMADLKGKFDGDGSKAVKELFKEARKLAPIILFLDEAEALFLKRGSSDSDSKALNQFLVELDGYSKSDGGKDEKVFIIAATNLPENLDSAIIRPGRLDNLVYVAPPDEKSRLSILKKAANKYPFASNLNFELVASKTRNFSCADLAWLIKMASRIALKEAITIGSGKVSHITQEHFEDALGFLSSSLSKEDIQRLEKYSRDNNIL